MRPNAFQKILSLVYLCLIAVSCVFYVPFRNMHGRYDTEIVYDAIWSDNSNIDLYRIAIYLLVISVTFYFLYRYLNRMNDLEASTYKRKAKRELITFIVFISAISLCLLFLIGSNITNQLRRKSLITDIQNTQTLIAEKSAKREAKKAIRSNFWDESRKTFNLDEFENNVQNYWERLIKQKAADAWVSSFYEKFPTNNLKQFGINNPVDLKHFIEVNAYDDDDVQKQEEVKALSVDLNTYQTKKDSITFYQDNDIRRITLIFLTILFGILYIGRPLILFIKGIFTELK